MIAHSVSSARAFRFAGVGSLVSAQAVVGYLDGGPLRGRRGMRRGDRGATAVEYALMVSLIAVVIIGAVALFGQNMIQLFNVPASAL